MAKVEIPFWTQTEEPRSAAISTARLVNLYLEKAPEGSSYPFALLPTPGLSLFATCGSGPVRGMISAMGALWVVSGTELYSVSSSGEETLVGDIGGVGPVYMIENGIHIGIGTTADTYAANGSGIIILPEPGMVGAAYFDGYGIFAQGGSERFFITGIDDMTTIAALDFSSADTFADLLVGCINVNRDLLLIGERTVEGWYNSGDARFPFSRSQGAFIEHGCVSSSSIAKAENMAIWLGDDHNVWAAQGYQPRKLSPPWIANIITEQPDISSSRAFVYSSGGHTFYSLSFAGKTLAFDFDSGAWHERKSFGLNRWRAACGSRCWRKNYVGDCLNGNVYLLSESVYTDNGDPIVREAVSTQIRNRGDRAAMANVQLEMETGTGLDGAVQGSDPVAYLSWSDDDGNIWSAEREAKMGKIGERGTTVRWNRLGAFRRRSLRFRTSEPIPFSVVSAFADIEARV